MRDRVERRIVASVSQVLNARIWISRVVRDLSNVCLSAFAPFFSRNIPIGFRLFYFAKRSHRRFPECLLRLLERLCLLPYFIQFILEHCPIYYFLLNDFSYNIMICSSGDHVVEKVSILFFWRHLISHQILSVFVCGILFLWFSIKGWWLALIFYLVFAFHAIARGWAITFVLRCCVPISFSDIVDSRLLWLLVRRGHEIFLVRLHDMSIFDPYNIFC